MKLQRIDYKDLNAKQKENYNYHKVSSLLADYGFSGILLSDDYHGADFLAKHKDGEILKVQLKGRVVVAKKYIAKDLYMAFPIKDRWCLIPHDILIDLPEILPRLTTKSWARLAEYHAPSISKKLEIALSPYLL